MKISQRTTEKLLAKHNVTREEITQCFLNREGPAFRDSRANHQTDPPTMWFVATTDRGRVLKVVYMEYADGFVIKTAFEPKDGSDALYDRLCSRNTK